MPVNLYFRGIMVFKIREFRDSDPVSEITDLLHRAYKPLADAGWKYVASYQDDTRTLHRIKTGRCFLLTDQDKIIGTIVYYTTLYNRPDCPAIYNETGFSHFGQFAVEPFFQKQGLGSMLMNHVEQFAQAEGNHTICFDTSEHAHHLIDYYKKRGYEFAAYHQWVDTNYRSAIMKKVLPVFSNK
jgi:ribosomal protein S18 acetylase RimI-like enzyme